METHKNHADQARLTYCLSQLKGILQVESRLLTSDGNYLFLQEADPSFMDDIVYYSDSLRHLVFSKCHPKSPPMDLFMDKQVMYATLPLGDYWWVIGPCAFIPLAKDQIAAYYRSYHYFRDRPIPCLDLQQMISVIALLLSCYSGKQVEAKDLYRDIESLRNLNQAFAKIIDDYPGKTQYPIALTMVDIDWDQWRIMVSEDKVDKILAEHGYDSLQDWLIAGLKDQVGDQMKVSSTLFLYGLYLEDPDSMARVNMIGASLRDLMKTSGDSKYFIDQLIKTFHQWKDLSNIQMKPDQMSLKQVIWHQVRQMIESDLSRAWSREIVAQQLSIHPNSLDRICQKELGQSFNQYLVSERIKTAKRMLQHSDKRIDEIGKLVGYSNYRSFLKVFDHYVGMPPSTYRKEYNNFT